MNSNKSKMNMTNQEKLDEMYDTIQDLKKDHDYLVSDIDDMHHTLNWIRRRERIRMTLSILYWTAIIGIVFGAYYYIQPLINGLLLGLTGSTDTFQNLEKTVGGLPDLGNLKKIFDLFRASSTAN